MHLSLASPSLSLVPLSVSLLLSHSLSPPPLSVCLSPLFPPFLSLSFYRFPVSLYPPSLIFSPSSLLPSAPAKFFNQHFILFHSLLSAYTEKTNKNYPHSTHTKIHLPKAYSLRTPQTPMQDTSLESQTING